MTVPLASSQVTRSLYLYIVVVEGMLTQLETLYVSPAVRLGTVCKIVRPEPASRCVPAKLPPCTASLLRVKRALVVQLSGLTPLAASSKPGLSSRLPGGGVVTVKLLALVAVPPGVVTLIDPLVAPVGTVARICVLESTVKLATAVPLKATAVAPLKLFPLIVTVVPTGPLIGLKELIVGGEAVTVKLLALVAVPAGVVTLIDPLVAPVGTVARICVLESTVKLATAVTLKATAVAPLKLFP